MQIAELQKDMAKERDDLINRLKADYETAKRRESVFASAYEQQSERVSEHGDKAVRYNMLKRDVDSDRKLYETLLQKVDEVGLAAALHTSTISVVDSATVPDHPYSPNVLASVGIGVFGGSLLGICLSFLRTRSDRTLRGPGEASIHLQLRELGVIPSIRNPRFNLLPGRVRSSGRLARVPFALRESVIPDKPVALSRNFPSSVALATWLGIPEVTEAIFGTMSSLRFAMEQGEQTGVIVVTSPEAGEGKTTVATNLAIALAQIGRRVVLVDGDLRRPRLDRIFETECVLGLSDLLDSADPIDDVTINRFLVKTAVPNLTLLPTNAASDGICTKIHSLRMRVLLERLRKEFDNVVIDSPPMIHIADARVLGWLADGAVLVLRAHKTTRDSALAAYDCLLQDGTHVLGTVLNDWNPRRSDRYSAYVRTN
jgi:succinoglycan biosynthesis transport protein ExoP